MSIHRRPTDRTLGYVLRWLNANGMQVAGPCIDFKTGKLIEGSTTHDRADYDLASILALVKLRKENDE